MRFDPLTYAEQKMFERELLRDLGYADEEQSITYNANGTSTVETHWKIREGHDRNVVKALRLARTFNMIVNNEAEQPACFDDLVLEVRYKMGYGWLAWFLLKNFAIPVLRWLWNRYHNSIPNGAAQRAN